nr:hypothetical protein Iba_scaffold14897CG0540 [Ipomoea batatas]
MHVTATVFSLSLRHRLPAETIARNEKNGLNGSQVFQEIISSYSDQDESIRRMRLSSPSSPAKTALKRQSPSAAAWSERERRPEFAGVPCRCRRSTLLLPVHYFLTGRHHHTQ